MKQQSNGTSSLDYGAFYSQIDRVREYNLSELLVEGEELAEEVKKHEGFLRST